MDMLSSEQFEQLLPFAATWAEQQEMHILKFGTPLSPSQLSDAREMGVAHPERVRLLSIGTIPIPEDPVLRAAAEATQLISSFTAGLTLRYGNRSVSWPVRLPVFPGPASLTCCRYTCWTMFWMRGLMRTRFGPMALHDGDNR